LRAIALIGCVPRNISIFVLLYNSLGNMSVNQGSRVMPEIGLGNLVGKKGICEQWQRLATVTSANRYPVPEEEQLWQRVESSYRNGQQK